MVFSTFFIYTYSMKKLLLFLLTCICAGAAVQAAPVFADDYAYQKQLIINGNQTCQAFRIHPHWFATAAHCVDSCVFAGACDIKILLAQGPVSASARVEKKDLFVPKQYRTVDAKKRISTHKFWDVALIHYQPQEYVYEFAEGGAATQQEFDQALQSSYSLRVQWKGATWQTYPVLYSYSGEELMQLQQNLIVPRWNFGQMQSFSNPQTVLYFGENKSLWGADGFGVDHGNSGGAVVLADGGIVGIATAKMDNNLPAQVRQAFPKFGQSHEFFIFNGFAPQTTLKFIEKTMLRFGDRPRVEKLKQVQSPEKL